MLAIVNTRRRYLVVNLNFANKPAKACGILQELEQEFDPDVWLIVEAKRVRVRRCLGARTWRAHQGITMGRQNNAVVWTRDLRAGRRRFIIGTLPHGHSILPRWLNRVRVAGVADTAVHVPPSRDQALVPGFMRQMERHTYTHPITWGGDKNAAPMKAWAGTHGYQYREAGVMFFATDLQIHDTTVVHRPGLDHAVLVVDVIVGD